MPYAGQNGMNAFKKSEIPDPANTGEYVYFAQCVHLKRLFNWISLINWLAFSTSCSMFHTHDATIKALHELLG